MKRCAIYTRVSTSSQSCDAQLGDLRKFAAERGWEVVEEYSDEGVSGVRERRPALDRLMGDARRRRFGVVLCWRFDRFARSTRFLVEALETFRALGIDFVSFQEALDTSTPMGSCVFLIISALARLERDIIAERVKAGLRRARAEGKTLGRPRLQVDERQLRLIASQKLPVRAAAKALGISPSSYLRLVRGQTAPSSELENAQRA